jgi:hypothetical protein
LALVHFHELAVAALPVVAVAEWCSERARVERDAGWASPALAAVLLQGQENGSVQSPAATALWARSDRRRGGRRRL